MPHACLSHGAHVAQPPRTHLVYRCALPPYKPPRADPSCGLCTHWLHVGLLQAAHCRGGQRQGGHLRFHVACQVNKGGGGAGMGPEDRGGGGAHLGL